MILRFEGVSYRYGTVSDWALRELNLAVRSEETLLLAGASGSGKSTLCRASVGLVPHFHGGEWAGRVLVGGMDTRSHPVYQLYRHAGLVFQNSDAQLFNRTVEAEIVYGLESLGLAPVEIEKRLGWAGSLVEIGGLLGRPPHALSGGEKQRVALGAILALRPRLLLLDEPFTHLDMEGSRRIRAILGKIRAEGMAVIVSEHRLHEVIADVDRLVVLYEGRAALDGEPRQVLSQEITGYGLNLPPLVRLFRSLGLPERPLTVAEAVRYLPLLFDSSSLSSPGQSLKSSRLQAHNTGSLLEVDRIWFSYGSGPVLKGVSLNLGRGESVALVGRNGAGKTTLVKHFNGLLKPNQGMVRVLGRDTRKVPVAELARYIGFVWQNPNDQLFQPNVREEVLTGPRVLHALDPVWCDSLFERFRLGPLLGRSPFRLSEGQKKRVAFAAGLSVRPELIVLDEPTAGQDEPFRRELGRLIRELKAEGRTVILVTHDLEFAAEHAERWLAMADGRIVADGTPEMVMADSSTMKEAGLQPTQRFQLAQALAKSISQSLSSPGPHGH